MDRDKALDMALSQIERNHGKGSIMRMGERTSMDIETVPTGALSLDLALGIGGLPRGRIVEIYGPESSGKSTLAMHAVAEAQRNGGICAYIDAEHAMDPVYANAIGVDIDELLISQPDTGEQALEIADTLIRSGALDVVVIDSVAALTPRAEIEGEMGDSHVGLQARLMSQALRKLTANLSKSKTIAIFINQLREKIGVMFGSPETTPGGRALKFYSSVRLDIRRIEAIKDGVEVTGSRTRVKVVKNKCVAAGTTVFDPVSGVTHRIEDIVECGAGEAVVAADKVGTLHARPIVQRFDQGEAEVIGLHLRDGTELWVTPDHKVMTDHGWREAGSLVVGDALARPRRAFGFGDAEPVSADAARLLGYLLGRGHAGGATPCAFVDLPHALHGDAGTIAASLGAEPRADGRYLSFGNGAGDRPNGVLDLARRAGVWDLMPSEVRVPAELMDHDVAEPVVSNLVFGLLETTGRVTRRGGDVGLVFTTPSEQLAHQLHWLLLRWGIGSTVRAVEAGQGRGRRRGKGGVPAWDVTVAGVDDVARFAEVVATWGPQGRDVEEALGDPALPARRATHRDHLPADQTEPVLAYLEGRGLGAAEAARLIGVDVAGDPGAGLAGVLGAPRLRRDRLEALAVAIDSEFLRGVLSEDVWYDRIVDISPAEWRRIYDIEVDEHHTFVADGVVVSNCAPPFRQCEFDIMYGRGISREGSLVDIGVDLGIVKKSGAWYTYEGEQLGQGRENAKAFLADNLDVMMEIDQRIRRQSGLDGTVEEGEDQAEADAEAEAADPDDQPITLD